MQISAATSILPVSAVDRTATGTQAHINAPETAKGNAAAQATTQPKVFTPAPPLRPNVQDFVDIDRTLIMLRQGA